MKANFINREINTVKIEMEVTAEEFESAINKVFYRNRNRFSIPGFRKGKATRKMIESHYGKDIFIEDAVSEVFNEEYPKALEELGFEPVDHPEIDLKDQVLQSGSGINFNISFLVSPELTVENYKGVKLILPKAEVTDEEVEEQLKSYAVRNARLVSVDRAAEKGDTLILDYKGFTYDDEQFEGGTAENAKLKLGSNQFIPGFEDELIGVKAGEERTVNVRFPEDYPVEKLAGELVRFECVVHDVKEEDVPPVDDELAKECSEFDTIEEWKVEIRKNLEDNKKKQAEASVQNEAMRTIYNNTVVDMPEVMIEHEIDDLLRQFDQQLGYSGMNLQQYLAATQTDMSEFREQIRDEAERKVKTRLIIEAVAKQENIEATEEETEEALKNMGVQYGVDAAKMRELVGGDIKYVEKDVCARKAFKIIADSAEVEWVDAVTENESADTAEEETPAE